MPNRKRDSEGRFASGSFVDAMRDRPYATAAAAAGVAAAGAFLWSKRDRISDMASSGMDKVSELKSQRMSSGRSRHWSASSPTTAATRYPPPARRTKWRH